MDLKNCARETMKRTVGESSKFLEATEPTEEEGSAFLAIRKDESDPVEEESGDEEVEDENEEETPGDDVEEESGDEDSDSEDENEEEAPVDDEALAHYYAILAKREAAPAEESGYSVDESSDEEKESSDEEKETVATYTYSGDTLTITPKWWVEPEWDVDSFDGVVYDSSEEHDAMTDEELERDWRRFKRQFTESKGFYVEPELMPMYNYSRYRAVGDLERDAGCDQTYREYFADRARNCVKKYNEENSEKNGFNVEFVDVVRGAFTGGPKSKSYITIMAREVKPDGTPVDEEKPDGTPVEYQCKAWSTFVRHEHYPILCRPAPTPTVKLSNQN